MSHFAPSLGQLLAQRCAAATMPVISSATAPLPVLAESLATAFVREHHVAFLHTNGTGERFSGTTHDVVRALEEAAPTQTMAAAVLAAVRAFGTPLQSAGWQHRGLRLHCSLVTSRALYSATDVCFELTVTKWPSSQTLQLAAPDCGYKGLLQVSRKPSSIHADASFVSVRHSGVRVCSKRRCTGIQLTHAHSPTSG